MITINLNVFPIHAPLVKNMDSGSFGFIQFLYKMSSKFMCRSSFKERAML